MMTGFDFSMTACITVEFNPLTISAMWTSVSVNLRSVISVLSGVVVCSRCFSGYAVNVWNDEAVVVGVVVVATDVLKPLSTPSSIRLAKSMGSSFSSLEMRTDVTLNPFLPFIMILPGTKTWPGLVSGSAWSGNTRRSSSGNSTGMPSSTPALSKANVSVGNTVVVVVVPVVVVLVVAVVNTVALMVELSSNCSVAVVVVRNISDMGTEISTLVLPSCCLRMTRLSESAPKPTASSALCRLEMSLMLNTSGSCSVVAASVVLLLLPANVGNEEIEVVDAVVEVEGTSSVTLWCR